MREPRSGLHRIKSEEVHFQDDSPEDYQVNETETQVQNRNSMNNLLSYCGLVDAKTRASDKDLPVLYWSTF